MAYLAMFHWGWLFGAFLLGLGMGWIALVRRGKTVSKALSQQLSVLVAALIAIALGKLIPGRLGYWLELGLALFGCYLVGCAIGSWLRGWVVSRHVPAA